MISALFIYLVAALLGLVTSIFSLVAWVIPASFQSSLVMVFGYLRYLNGLVPVDTFVQILVFLFGTFALTYAVRLVLWFISWIPGLYQAREAPSGHVLDLRSSGIRGRNVVDLRGGRKSSSRPRIMQDIKK